MTGAKPEGYIHVRLAPCRCGHPGLGCYCYPSRLAEAEAEEKRLNAK